MSPSYVRVLNALCHLTQTALKLQRNRNQKDLDEPLSDLAAGL